MGPIDDDITTHLTLRRQSPDLTTESKTIYPIADEDLGKFKVLGQAVGEFYGQAIYEAFLHGERFFERAAGYRLVRPPELDTMECVTGRSFVSIEFYELRGSSN